MEKFKQILKKIFFLPPLPTALFAFFGYALIIAVAAFHISIPSIQYFAYGTSAYVLVVTITGFPYFLAFVKGMKEKIEKNPLMEKIQSTPIGSRFFQDVRFRTEISLYQGFFINLLYIVMKLVSGIYYRSMWFVSLAVYYALLAVMRIMLLRRGKKNVNWTKMETELHRYRICGILLFVMNQALAGIVIFMVQQNQGFHYPGLLIYAMAVYSFYSIITAVIKVVKFKKHGSPILSAAKAIDLVAAMVSILSLTTAMLSQFGGDDQSGFRQIMTASVGGSVCTIVIGMAIFMICKSTKKLKSKVA